MSAIEPPSCPTCKRPNMAQDTHTKTWSCWWCGDKWTPEKLFEICLERISEIVKVPK